MVRHYTTSCDSGYLARLKVLFWSMQRWCRPFKLHVLAYGADVVRWCNAQDPEIVCTPVGLFLHRHPRYVPGNLPGPPRERMDEILCTYRWRHLADTIWLVQDGVTCIDADVMFWSSPWPVFDEIGSSPIALVPHDLPRLADGLPGVSVESHGAFGRYNGGYAHFRSLDAALHMAALTWEWCYPRWREHPGGRRTYGDQGYLELIQERYGATVISYPGAAPGPWSVHRHQLSVREGDRVYFGGVPLVAFHYSGFRPGGRATDAGYGLTPVQEAILYRPYRDAIAQATA